MFDDLPTDVQNILKDTLRQIQDVLIAQNKLLEALDRANRIDDYALIGTTI